MGSLSKQLLCRLSAFVVDRIGLHFPRERWLDLERGVRAAATVLGVEDAHSFAESLLSGSVTQCQIEALSCELTIGETYFFREPRSFDILAERILPELICIQRDTGAQLRLWSAGCCTGEEPYSIAIVLDRLLPDAQRSNVMVLGTDINPRFLSKATQGRFSEWSFRDAPPWLKPCYFRQTGERHYEILPRIRNMVTFGYLNLAEDTYPLLTHNTAAMHVIFCRNLLMYFEPERAKRVVGKLHRALAPDGWFVAGAVETGNQLFSEFTPIAFDRATIYRKAAACSETTGVDIAHAMTAGAASESSTLIKETVIPPARESNSHTDETVDGIIARARRCANLGDLDEALQWAERGVAVDKLNPTAHYLRAIILQERGAAEDARACLRRTLYLDPNFLLAHVALGNLALRGGQFQAADKHFNQAITLLQRFADDETLPQSEGWAAGKLRQLLQSTMSMEQRA